MSREDLFQNLVCVCDNVYTTVKSPLPPRVWCDECVMTAMLWTQSAMTCEVKSRGFHDHRECHQSQIIALLSAPNNAMFAPLALYSFVVSPLPTLLVIIRSPLIHDNMREEIWKYQGLNMNISHEIRDIIRTPLWLSPQVRGSMQQLPICRYATHFLSRHTSCRLIQFHVLVK